MAYSCGIHEFSTDDIAEWHKHQAEEEHEHSGETTCKDCHKPGIKIEYTGKIHAGKVAPAYCEECLSKLKVRFS